MSYAEVLLAIVPAAPPTRKNQRATSCPAPISANVPYLVLSRLIWTAFWCVSSRFDCIAFPVPGGWLIRRRPGVDDLAVMYPHDVWTLYHCTAPGPLALFDDHMIHRSRT